MAIRPQEVPDVAIELGEAGIAAEPDHADRVAAAVAVTSAMAGLSSDHQQVLRHLYWGDRSVADTAADIGITVGTVKSRAHYAIAALRKALAGGHCGPGVHGGRDGAGARDLEAHVVHQLGRPCLDLPPRQGKQLVERAHLPSLRRG
jgi:hypothetical protein